MTQPQRPSAVPPAAESLSAPASEPRQPDFYLEHGNVVFTAAYHLKRGHCCGNGCRHCPYDPPHVEGGRSLAR